MSKVKEPTASRFPEKVLIGEAFLWGYNFKMFYTIATEGGTFSFPVPGRPWAEVRLGGGSVAEWKLLGYAIHEMEEFCFVAGGQRFRPTGSLQDGSNATLFVVTHEQLAEVNLAGAGALEPLWPTLLRVHRRAVKFMRRAG